MSNPTSAVIGGSGFYERLVAATAAERTALHRASIIQAAMAGTVQRADYVAFLTQAYHHVRHTVPLMMACGGRLGADYEWLRERIARYIEEEIGHQEWILADIRNAGGDAEAARRSHPAPATELMVAYAYDTIARRNPVAFFGMVFVLETTSTELASRAAGRLQGALDLPRTAFTYLTSHGTLDLQHVEFLRALVERLDLERDREDVLQAARMFFRLYGDVFRSITPVAAPGEEAA